MQADWYKKNGFELSSLVSQATIDRAESEVTKAYIEPIMGEGASGDDVDLAVGNLAFLLILQRSIVGTRAGAKVKQTQTSNGASGWDVVAQEALACHARLETLRATDGANKDAEVYDLCKIYFRTNFFAL